MTDFVSGTRRGAFILLVDEDGRRHAVRWNAVLGVHDLDEDGTNCMVTMSGGRMARIMVPLEQVLGWLDIPSR